MAAQGARPVRDIVDLGCATGLSSLALAKEFPEASVTGIDASPHFLAVGRYEQQQRQVMPQGPTRHFHASESISLCWRMLRVSWTPYVAAAWHMQLVPNGIFYKPLMPTGIRGRLGAHPLPARPCGGHAAAQRELRPRVHLPCVPRAAAGKCTAPILNGFTGFVRNAVRRLEHHVRVAVRLDRRAPFPALQHLEHNGCVHDRSAPIQFIIVCAAFVYDAESRAFCDFCRPPRAIFSTRRTACCGPAAASASWRWTRPAR